MTIRTTFRILPAILFFSMAAASQAQSMVPTSVSLKPSQTQKFSVQNTGNKVYFWSLSPSVGTISTVGVYQAPATITASSTVKIFASSPGRPVLSAKVTLLPVVNISVAPTWVSLTNGQSAAFSATVAGASNTAVTWSTPSFGSMTPGGVYTAPMTLSTQQNITVTAKSVTDPSKAASATIALIPTITVTVNPTSTVLRGGQSTALNGVVNGASNGAITWSISPAVGTITNGIYTAPLPVAAAQTVTVTATSQASTGRSGSAVLSLIPVSIAVTPATALLSSGQSEAITATLSGTDNLAVNWTVTPAVGTFANGVYQAPTVISTAQTITVKATSAADSSKSASSLISLNP
jgi:trimeric autotransporter adhesin